MISVLADLVDFRGDSNSYDVNPTGCGAEALTYWTKKPNRLAKYEFTYLHGVETSLLSLVHIVTT